MYENAVILDGPGVYEVKAILLDKISVFTYYFE